jgi:hypothetical protein
MKMRATDHVRAPAARSAGEDRRATHRGGDGRAARCATAGAALLALLAIGAGSASAQGVNANQQRPGPQQRHVGALARGLFGARARHASWDHSSPPPFEGVQAVATGLNQPKKITSEPDGNLVVALSGNGLPSSDCFGTEEPACLNSSGQVDRITPAGRVTALLKGLPSVESGGQAVGPSEARETNGALEVLFQDEDISPETGEQPFGPEGSLLGDLARFPFYGPTQVQAQFGPFEAQNNPDGGAGTAVELGMEPAIDSDPYSFVAYRGGYVVADAAGNDLLYVSRSGQISVLAVFPTISETVEPGTLGPEQTEPIPFQAQAVPDSVAVGPEGALYVGELGGFPFNVGASDVYRVVPGQQPTVYASGFTTIGDLTFDTKGRLLVLEIDQKGLEDPALAEGGLPTPGEIIGIHRDGSEQELAAEGLEFPTGIAETPRGEVFVSNFGVLPASGGPYGLSGEVARVGLPASWVRSSD